MKTKLDSEKLYWASFNRFELRLPGEAVNDIAQPGPADSAVEYWVSIVREMNLGEDISPKELREELKEYGAWDAKELADTEANWQRLVWIAACNIAEEETPDCSGPVKPE